MMFAVCFLYFIFYFSILLFGEYFITIVSKHNLELFLDSKCSHGWMILI